MVVKQPHIYGSAAVLGFRGRKGRERVSNRGDASFNTNPLSYPPAVGVYGGPHQNSTKQSVKSRRTGKPPDTPDADGCSP